MCTCILCSGGHIIGNSEGIRKILIAYARYTVQNACVSIWYRSWLLERNGEGKCVLLFLFRVSLFHLTVANIFSLQNLALSLS